MQCLVTNLTPIFGERDPLSVVLPHLASEISEARFWPISWLSLYFFMAFSHFQSISDTFSHCESLSVVLNHLQSF